MEFQAFKDEFVQLISNGTPIMFRVAADKLIAFADKESDNRAAQEVVLWCSDFWHKLLVMQMKRFQQVMNDSLPHVVLLHKEWLVWKDVPKHGRGTTPSPDEDNFFPDGFFEEKNTGKVRVRPSHVPEPGTLDAEWVRTRELGDEDMLRSMCVGGVKMTSDGSFPREPFLAVEGEDILDIVIARLYRRRQIDRVWPWIARPGKWDVDTALIEDYTLLNVLVYGPLGIGALTKRMMLLQPFVRRFDERGLFLAAGRVRRRFERSGMLVRSGPKSVRLKEGLGEQLKTTVLARWIDANKGIVPDGPFGGERTNDGTDGAVDQGPPA